MQVQSPADCQIESSCAVLRPAGCVKANLNATVEAYAVEFAAEETAHVTLLFNALTAAGLKPVCPLVNIGEG